MFADVVREVAGLDDAGLVDCLRAAERDRRAVEARIAAVLAEADRRGLYAVDGHRGVGGWAASITRWSLAELRARSQLARLVARLPGLGEALYEGIVGVAQAFEIARAGCNPRCGDRLDGELVTMFIEQAQVLTFDEFRTCVRRWEMLADTDGALRDRDAAHDRRTATVTVFDGVLDVAARGGGVDGAAIVEIFGRFVDAEFRTDWDTAKARYGDETSVSLLERTDAQRRFDALAAIFAAAVVAPVDGKAPEPVVNIVVDETTFLTYLTEAGLTDLEADEIPQMGWHRRRCETTAGTLVHPVDAVAAAITGHVRRVVLGGDGTITDMGRRRRLFTGAARAAVMLQSTRCCWPGCDMPTVWCQADHRDEWVRDHGVTSVDNGVPLCGHHNRFKHRTGYRVTRDSSGHWHTWRPDNTEVA